MKLSVAIVGLLATASSSHAESQGIARNRKVRKAAKMVASSSHAEPQGIARNRKVPKAVKHALKDEFAAAETDVKVDEGSYPHGDGYDYEDYGYPHNPHWYHHHHHHYDGYDYYDYGHGEHHYHDEYDYGSYHYHDDGLPYEDPWSICGEGKEPCFDAGFSFTGCADIWAADGSHAGCYEDHHGWYDHGWHGDDAYSYDYYYYHDEAHEEAADEVVTAIA